MSLKVDSLLARTYVGERRILGQAPRILDIAPPMQAFRPRSTGVEAEGTNDVSAWQIPTGVHGSVSSNLDVADRKSPVVGGSIILKRRVRPESGGNRLDEPQVRPRTSPTTQEWGRKAAQSAQIRSL